MGFVDDYCGGYENLALYTDDDGDVDFEGAYESGLDGFGFGFGGGSMGLDQWPVDADEWDEDMEEDTLYRGDIRVHCTGCGDLLNNLQMDYDSFEFGTEPRDLTAENITDTESKELQWIIDNELHSQLWPQNPDGKFLLACSHDCLYEYLQSLKEEGRTKYRENWLKMLDNEEPLRYKPRARPSPPPPRKPYDPNQRCPFPNKKKNGLCGNPPARDCANDACAKHCKKLGTGACERHAPGWEMRRLMNGW